MRCTMAVLALGYNKDSKSLHGLLCREAYFWDSEQDLVLLTKAKLETYDDYLDARISENDYESPKERQRLWRSKQASEFVLG